MRSKIKAQGLLVGIPIISEFIRLAKRIKVAPKAATIAIKSTVFNIVCFVFFEYSIRANINPKVPP